MFGKTRRINELEEENRLLKKQLQEKDVELNNFSQFQANYPVAFFSIDPNRKIIDYNNEFISITGFSSSEIDNAKGAAMILWPIDPSQCKVCKLAMEYINLKKSGRGNAFITTKDKKEVPVYVYVVPIFNNGEIVRTYILLRDQTEEINNRISFLNNESKPIIEILNNIVHGKIDTKLSLNNSSELKHFEQPINDILDSLSNIINQVTNSTTDLIDMTEQSSQKLDTTVNAINDLSENITNNTKEIKNMSQQTQSVTNSLKNELSLATQTVQSMDEINEQVNFINDSISVIDQIAFQTNILSLNAAVEAATAGEAGKGFAVVAQEVRNLASRSAEAANEIKKIVEIATSKTNEGKNISTQMINGFELLDTSINTMATIIDTVTNSATNQQQNMQDINESLNDLSTQIKHSADVASKTKEDTFKILHIA